MGWIYTNVGHSAHPSGLSTYFGYAKLEDGSFIPYRCLHPQNEYEKLEKAIFFEQRRLAADTTLNDLERFDRLKQFIRDYEPENTKLSGTKDSHLREIDRYISRRNDGNIPV